MKKRVWFVISFICLVFLIINMDKPKASNSEEFLTKIVNEVEGDIQECGVKASFISYDDEKETVEGILKNLKFEEPYHTNIKENEKIYSIEIIGNNISGYVQSTKYENYKVIVVDLVKVTENDELYQLEEIIKNAIGNESASYFKYIKARLHTNDLMDKNNKIMALLKRNNAQNIESIKIDNGYSTIAYTKKFDHITVGRKFVDLNYALCSYRSGNYLIIGTPEILVSY
ncbi:YwmB family TATA-box binding protein [Clostridium sp. MSJ-11]|uniref:YwmB family TATA-box binding protein n=1 Tax=Clostridium mobile TaxID=2841512 RepID=A0ABS6EP01_9CLOT|nr:YwmB family TATA-box binding protein [Clostridium mobile]MBU5486114.1 YwmB family TATA-box binding protein [Clostridium mobile]